MKNKTILSVYIEENFAVKELREAGMFQSKDPNKPNYIKNLKDYEAIANRIKTFFGLKRIYDYSKLKPFGPGLDEERVEFISCKEWITEGNRLINLIENN